MDGHDTRFNRRGVLRGTVVGLLGVGLAGCSGPGEEEDEEDGGGEETDGGGEEEDDQLQGPDAQ